MKKAIFWSARSNHVFSVFSPELIARIRQSVELPDAVYSPADLDKVDFSDVDFIFSTWGVRSLTSEEWRRYFPKLTHFFYGAGATDDFALPLLENKIHISSAWRANAIPVAEYVVSAILLGLKNFFQLTRSIHSPETWATTPRGRGAYGTTVTLLGSTGAIATLVARELEKHDLKVIGIPSPVAERTTTLEEAFAVSQVVSNHLPNRNDNVGCIDGKLLASMPANALFINTGRGRQVNEKEMIEVLKQRPDLTVLLDVQCPEPPEEGSELYSLPNVFLTPHIAGSLGDEVQRMGKYAVEEMERVLRGESLLHEIQESYLLTYQDKK